MGGKIIINVEPINNGQYMISVKDFGIGMNSSEIEKIFAEGMNISKEGTKKERGSGLGLWFCNYFLIELNSKLNVLSVEGEGSEFSFIVKRGFLL